jgi:AraC-like DNA-binding protein
MQATLNGWRRRHDDCSYSETGTRHEHAEEREDMSGDSIKGDDLDALRRTLWEVAEHAQRAIAQIEAYAKSQQDNDESEAGAAQRSGDAQGQAPESALASSMIVTAGQAGAAGTQSREVRRALRHIDQYYDRPLDLGRLSRIAGCSRSTLTRSFRREFGLTVHDYVVGIRLARAVEAMTKGEKIESVMLAVGFRSKRTFYQLFKKQFGRTPAQLGQPRRSVEGEIEDGEQA